MQFVLAIISIVKYETTLKQYMHILCINWSSFNKAVSFSLKLWKWSIFILSLHPCPCLFAEGYNYWNVEVNLYRQKYKSASACLVLSVLQNVPSVDTTVSFHIDHKHKFYCIQKCGQAYNDKCYFSALNLNVKDVLAVSKADTILRIL